MKLGTSCCILKGYKNDKNQTGHMMWAELRSTLCWKGHWVFSLFVSISTQVIRFVSSSVYTDENDDNNDGNDNDNDDGNNVNKNDDDSDYLFYWQTLSEQEKGFSKLTPFLFSLFLLCRVRLWRNKSAWSELDWHCGILSDIFKKISGSKLLFQPPWPCVVFLSLSFMHWNSKRTR